MDLLVMHTDLLAMSVSLAALVMGAAIGWLVARSRFVRTIAELNTNLVLERRVNKQLSETAQLDTASSFIHAPVLTASVGATREQMVVSN